MLKRIAWVASVIVLLGLLVAGAAFWHGGYRVYAVQTGSMMPTYAPGDLIVDGPAADSYVVGQVVTFGSQGGGVSELTTHRVFGFADGAIQTKGDANRTPDVATLRTNEVVGVPVAAITHAGYMLVFFHQPTGALSLMAGLFALTLLWQLFFPDGENERDEGEPGAEGHKERSRVSPRVA